MWDCVWVWYQLSARSIRGMRAVHVSRPSDLIQILKFWDTRRLPLNFAPEVKSCHIAGHYHCWNTHGEYIGCSWSPVYRTSTRWDHWCPEPCRACKSVVACRWRPVYWHTMLTTAYTKKGTSYMRHIGKKGTFCKEWYLRWIYYRELLFNLSAAYSTLVDLGEAGFTVFVSTASDL